MPLDSARQTLQATATRQLPYECLLTIARMSSGLTLTEFRLCCKAFRAIADPVLWHTVRVVPSIECLSSFCDTLLCRPIAAHIQCLVQDTSWDWSIADGAQRLGTKGDLENRLPPQGSSNGSRVSRGPGSRIESSESICAEACFLTRIMLQLPNLKSVRHIAGNLRSRWRTSSPMWELGVPPYYVAAFAETDQGAHPIRGSANLDSPQHGAHLRNLLMAAYTIPIKIESLRLDEVSWASLFLNPVSNQTPATDPLNDLTYLGPLFCSLKNLTIVLRAGSWDPKKSIGKLCSLLVKCSALETLKLSMNDSTPRKYPLDHRIFSFITPFVQSGYGNPTVVMPKLRHLELDNCTCTPNELIDLLRNHASSLRKLALSDISLLSNPDSDSRGCWVHVLRAIKHVTKLSEVLLRGWLSNGGRQRWYISENDPIDPSRLRSQIERYLTTRSVTQLPPALLRVALKRADEDVPKFRHGGEEEGDWSWTMLYSSSSSRSGGEKPPVTESMYSGDDFFSKIVPVNDSSSTPQTVPDHQKKLFKPCLIEYPKYPAFPPSKAKPTMTAAPKVSNLTYWQQPLPYDNSSSSPKFTFTTPSQATLQSMGQTTIPSFFSSITNGSSSNDNQDVLENFDFDSFLSQP